MIKKEKRWPFVNLDFVIKKWALVKRLTGIWNQAWCYLRKLMTLWNSLPRIITWEILLKTGKMNFLWQNNSTGNPCIMLNLPGLTKVFLIASNLLASLKVKSGRLILLIFILRNHLTFVKD